MQPKEPRSLEEVQKLSEDLRSRMVDSSTGFAKQLANRIDESGEEFNYDGLRNSIEKYVSDVIASIDSDKYTKVLDDQEFSKIFSAFREKNEDVFPDIPEEDQSEIENSFTRILAPLRRDFHNLNLYERRRS